MPVRPVSALFLPHWRARFPFVVKILVFYAGKKIFEIPVGFFDGGDMQRAFF
jgi:hypothetical protein